MDLKTLHSVIATSKLADSALATYQGKNVKVFFLIPGRMYIQKLCEIKHLKGISDNPYSAVVFIGYGTSPTDIIKGPLPKAVNIKPNHFYWFQGWDATTDAPSIFKAGKLETVLGVGVGSKDMVRVVYYAVNGAEETKFDIVTETATEVVIKTDPVKTHETGAAAKQEHRDKELEFWQRLNERYDTMKPKVDNRKLEILIPNLNTEQLAQVQSKFRDTTIKPYNDMEAIAIPYEVIYDTMHVRTLTDKFGLDWAKDVILRHVE